MRFDELLKQPERRLTPHSPWRRPSRATNEQRGPGFGSVTRRRAVDAVENSVDSAALAGLAAHRHLWAPRSRWPLVRAVFGRSRLSPAPGCQLTATSFTHPGSAHPSRDTHRQRLQRADTRRTPLQPQNRHRGRLTQHRHPCALAQLRPPLEIRSCSPILSGQPGHEVQSTELEFHRPVRPDHIEATEIGRNRFTEHHPAQPRLRGRPAGSD